jgi:hypothetical protein
MLTAGCLFADGASGTSGAAEERRNELHAGFGEFRAALSGLADKVKYKPSNQSDGEEQSEEQLGRNQLAHKIKLQRNEGSNGRPEPLILPKPLKSGTHLGASASRSIGCCNTGSGSRVGFRTIQLKR